MTDHERHYEIETDEAPPQGERVTCNACSGTGGERFTCRACGGKGEVLE